MRLKYVFISEYKNLKGFELDFDGASFIDIFVGKNGSGKSNLLEALIEIFRHLYEQTSPCHFEYKLRYVIDGKDVTIEWKQERFFLNEKSRGTKTFTSEPLPENILVYYSGHNETVKKILMRYEGSFRKHIRGANIDESRRFIGIGPEYKSLLLSVLLCQKNGCKAKSFVSEKLGITVLEDTLHVVLNRPAFADSRLKELGVESIERFDSRTHYWGADGITGQFLERVVKCVKGEFNHSSIYDSASDKYSIAVNIELFQKEFVDTDICEQFSLFDNLKTLGMLEQIRVPVSIVSGQEATLDYFSDGQFQSVYIYALTEMFKDRNCITFLDEPDSFLHPEWQFDFLKQVVQITDEASQTNHILMSSHSASTIASADENTINLLSFDEGKVVASKVKTSEVIKSLSAGLISFTEGEAHLNINHMLKNTTGPILFVEGISDEIILETAWNKLYPDRERPFTVQSAFCRSVLYSLFAGQEMGRDYGDRKIFALFDFDDAYDDWNGLNPANNSEAQPDPLKGLAKQLRHASHYAQLLPVPDIECIKNQVLDGDGKPWGKGADSHLPIELLFYREDLIGRYFVKKSTPGGGEIIKFTGKKTKFANCVVPNFAAEHFDIFRPIFEFIMSKSEADAEEVTA